MNILVQQATPEDARGITNVRRKTWLATYPNADAGITIADIQAAITTRTEEEESVRTAERIQSDTNTKTWVAKDTDRVVGFVTAVRRDLVNRIGSMYILPEYQHQGIGTKFMKEVLNWFGDRDVHFEVARYNKQAIQFYEQFGFVQTGDATNEAAKLPTGKVIPVIGMIKKNRTSEINIIVLSPSRWEDFKNLRLESLREEPQAFGMTVERALQQTEEKWKTTLAQAEKEDKDILYFAEDSGQLVGLMGAYFHKTPETEDTAMVYGAYVNKAYRGKGIGKQLLGKVVERLATVSGIVKVRLMVNQTEESAKKVYTDIGFQKVGETDHVLGDGKTHHLDIMEKQL